MASYGGLCSPFGYEDDIKNVGKSFTIVDSFSAKYTFESSDALKKETDNLKMYIVIGKRINHSTLGSQIFANLQPHFLRFMCILVKEGGG